MATAPTGAAKPLIATMAKTRSQVRFLLGPEPVSVALDDPTTTLLEYLRVSAALTGTKEGCAEGDCGACTVLLGELNKGRLRYTPANACILLLGMVDGKQVITVEHASHPEPHPVQRAMVDCDASQCGFCTPGFVMSLIGLQVTQAGTGVEAPPSREAIDQALAGNLCRCTGYVKILDAIETVARARRGEAEPAAPREWHVGVRLHAEPTRRRAGWGASPELYARREDRRRATADVGGRG